MSSITSNIRLNCFLRGETVNKIFDVEILTIENFERLDQIIRQDLLQICFNLHKVNFLQPNFFIVSSINTPCLVVKLFTEETMKKLGWRKLTLCKLKHI